MVSKPQARGAKGPARSFSNRKTRNRTASSFRYAIPEWASIPLPPTRFSILSSRINQAEWEWDWRLAVPSWRLTAASFGPSPTGVRVQRFSSRYPPFSQFQRKDRSMSQEQPVVYVLADDAGIRESLDGLIRS